MMYHRALLAMGTEPGPVPSNQGPAIDTLQRKVSMLTDAADRGWLCFEKGFICPAIEIKVGVLNILHLFNDFDVKRIVNGCGVETLEWFRGSLQVL